jgi:signal transduction histidine kinase
VFHSARLKLTLAYTVGIALIMAAFSVALYIALAGNIDVPGSGTERADQAIQAAQLARIRLVIAAVNVVGWVLAAGIAYVIAGRTLRPIAAALARQRQFTAHASHELRTPLTVMKGEIDVSLARERAPEQYRETLSRIDAEVFNAGAPIADSDLPHLFVPFYRGKGSDPDGGTGLGLALSDWVARAHGGSIMAQNSNGGVSFIVRLPSA